MEDTGFVFKNSAERISHHLQDYLNDFFALDVTLMGGGIEGVRKAFKDGFKVSTVEGYLETLGNPLLPKDLQDPIFIGKSKKLNELATQVNSLGADVDEETLKAILKETKYIVYS